jgi:hypothetical protein
MGHELPQLGTVAPATRRPAEACLQALPRHQSVQHPHYFAGHGGIGGIGGMGQIAAGQFGEAMPHSINDCRGLRRLEHTRQLPQGDRLHIHP